MALIKGYGGKAPRIDADAWVADDATVTGDVTLGPGSSLWFGVVVRGDVNHIRVGARSNIQDLTMLHVTHKKHSDDPGCPLVIGDDVTVGHSVTSRARLSSATSVPLRRARAIGAETHLILSPAGVLNAHHETGLDRSALEALAISGGMPFRLEAHT